MLMELTFIGIAIVAFLLFYLGTGKKVVILFIGLLWLTIFGFLAYANFFLNTSAFPPRMLWMLIPVFVLVIIGYKNISSQDVKPIYLMAIHTLRLPIELILYQLFLIGGIPKHMTFLGWNFDVLIGISAIFFLAYYLFANKKLNATIFRLWNIVGLLFLLTIVLIAVLSAPSPIQLFALENPNIALLTFPYTLLPAGIVPIVLLSHLLSLKIKRQD